MIAAVSVADLGAAGTVRSLLSRPAVGNVPGLRWSDVGVLAPLATTRPPRLRRAALFAFWDDEHAAEAFTEAHPVGRRFAGGFRATLRPIRAFGAWPGLPPEVPSGRAVPHDGPVMVVTLGRLRLSQTMRFIRASRPAEKSAVEAEGLLWGTAAARPPFVATISAWDNSQSTAAFAYGAQRPQHSNAIAAQQRKDFHRQSAFVRFAPIRVEGALDGPNPLSVTTLQV